MGMRSERVEGQLKKEISKILLEDLKDPRIGFVSVLEVKTSPDLREAKVFVSVFADEKEKRKTIKGLRSAAGFIHHEIKVRLSLRHIPSISFQLDNSIEHGSHVLDLINKISREEKIEQ